MAPIPSSLSASRLVKLSQTIAHNSKLLNAYLVEKKLPQPSFAADAPPDGIVIEKDEPRRNELDKARRELASATKELYDLSVGPSEGLRELGWNYNDQLSLHFIYRFGIARAFPAGSTITFNDLATKTKTPLHDLKRLVRHAITNRIFCEPVKNTIAHTAGSHLLATNPDLQAWTGMALEDMWPAAVNTCNAMERWPGSQEPTHTGLSVALGEEKHLFQMVTSDPERAKRFGTAMKSFSEGEAFDVSNLVRDFDWASLGNGKVVDVGGSLGFVSVALAQAFPQLRFVVQDLPKTYAKGDPKQGVPEAVRDRIEFMGHDFFQPQPVNDADVYLIRWCLHNWSDKYSAKILKALTPGLKKGARVIVNDGVLPDPKPPGPSYTSSAELSKAAATASASEGAEGAVDAAASADGEKADVDADFFANKSMRNLDLVMLELLNARERDVDEWKELFRQADERYIWKGARRSGNMWILEAEWGG